MSNAYATREEWLNALIAALRPRFAEVGAPVPTKLRASCGFPSVRPLKTEKNPRFSGGELWDFTRSEDGHYEMFVSPAFDDPLELASVVAHELVHAAVGVEAKHGPAFKNIAHKIGLTGPMPASVLSDQLKKDLAPLLEGLGPYPHAALDNTKAISNRPAKQSARLLKVQCPMCEYTVRITRKWLDEAGAPCCPVHGDKLEEEI